LIFNGAQTVSYSNTQNFTFDLGDGSLDLGGGTQNRRQSVEPESRRFTIDSSVADSSAAEAWVG